MEKGKSKERRFSDGHLSVKTVKIAALTPVKTVKVAPFDIEPGRKERHGRNWTLDSIEFIGNVVILVSIIVFTLGYCITGYIVHLNYANK